MRSLFTVMFFGLMVAAILQIVRKAGYSVMWALLLFVPIANIVVFLVFAFAPWPALQEDRRR